MVHQPLTTDARIGCLSLVAATQRHIEVLTCLQSAIMKREGDLIEALEFEAKEIGHNREQMTETYRHHLRTHRGASAGSAA